MLGMSKRVPDEVVPVLLPQPATWSCLDDVADYVRSCMEICGLEGWALQWDHAVRRLGCCKMTRRVLSFSQYFVEAYLLSDPELIRRTVLHELAHALAWVKYGEHGHGAAWRYFCAVLGIPGEKSACKCKDFTPPERMNRRPRYALCHCDTGEVYRYYSRPPRISPRKLAICYIPGKKEATLGKLCFKTLDAEES